MADGKDYYKGYLDRDGKPREWPREWQEKGGLYKAIFGDEDRITSVYNTTVSTNTFTTPFPGYSTVYYPYPVPTPIPTAEPPKKQVASVTDPPQLKRRRVKFEE